MPAVPNIPHPAVPNLGPSSEKHGSSFGASQSMTEHLSVLRASLKRVEDHDIHQTDEAAITHY
jgi:hypothetical protein